MATTISVDTTEKIWEFPNKVYQMPQEPAFIKKTYGVPKVPPKTLKGPNIKDLGSFTPIDFDSSPKGAIVLHEEFLDFSSTSPDGMPGILKSPLEHKPDLTPQYKQSSYDLTVGDISLSAHQVIRYIVFPASERTVILMNLRGAVDSNYVHKTEYYLQPVEGNAYLVPGYSANVKLELVFWDFERYTQHEGIYGCAARGFPIDSVVLLDPNHDKFCQSETPICLLGMDFLTKYPYLMFIPKLGSRGQIDFTLARNPLAYRPYTTFTEVSKELIVHIAACHDPETGRIGCGVFFKSGSILNLFSGVSKYDKDGNRHTEHLWERGILIGVLKVLHIISSFPAGHGFTDVTIRTGSPPINQLLTQIQDNKEGLYSGMNGNDGDPLDSESLCPSPHHDLVMYIHDRFLQKELGIKIRFEALSTDENYDAMEAAGVLAKGGAEMREFCLGSPVKKTQNLTLLGQYCGLQGKDIYVNFGIDGYFKIPSRRALGVMKAADKKADLSWSKEDAVYKLGYPAWEGEVAAEPNGFLDTKSYEFHKLSSPSDFKTLDGILGKDALEKLNNCLKDSNWTPEDILEIIKGSTRMVKVHEYLSLQKKEYRDEYLKELERKGLEKGWHFCKDRSWSGYLRRSTKIYDRNRWFCVQRGRQIEGSPNSGDNNHCWDKDVTEKPPGVGGNSHLVNNTGITSVINDSALNDSFTLEAFGTEYREESSNSDYTTGDDLDTKEFSDTETLMNFGGSVFGNSTTSSKAARTMTHMGIGARVAARHRRRETRSTVCADTDGSDSTYQSESVGGSEGNSSENWTDSEECTDGEELIDLDPSSIKQNNCSGARAGAARGFGCKGMPNSTAKITELSLGVGKCRRHQEAKENDKPSNYHHPSVEEVSWEPKGSIGGLQPHLVGNGGISDKNSEEESSFPRYRQKYSNTKDTSLSTQPWVPNGKHKIDLLQLKAENKIYPFISREYGISISCEDDGELDARIMGMERKWPPFEWALENGFPKKIHKACA